MGIRIHKVLGYGNTDFTPPPEWEELQERAYQISSEEFLLYCAAHRDEILEMSGEHPDFMDFHFRSLKDSPGPLGRCILHDEEMGLPRLLMLIPLGALAQWYRVDDSIDYYQEAVRQTHEPRVDELPHGIYPYSKGQPPPEIYGILLWLGLKDLKIQELLYTYWG